MIGEQAHACTARGDRIPIVLRGSNLSSPDDPDYLHETC
jgi:hypothetical protein